MYRTSLWGRSLPKTFRNSKLWLSSRRHKHSLHIWCIWTSRKETCCILFPIDPRYERVWWAWIDRFTQCTSHFRTSSCVELMIPSRTVLCYNAFCQCKRAFSLYYIASFRYTNLFIRKSDISTFIFCILYIKINYLQRDVIDICSNDGDKVPYKFFYIPRKKLMWFHNLIIKHLLVFILCFGRRPNSGDRSAEDAMTSLIKKCTWPVQCWNLS